MRAKLAHITVDGTPLCLKPDLMIRAGVDCGHNSIADATKARREIWRHVEWSRTKVVVGICPAVSPQ